MAATQLTGTEMTRLLFWTENFWPNIGGPEVIGAKLVLALRQRGYEVVVVTRHESFEQPDEVTYGDVPIRRFPFYQAFEQRDVRQLAEILRQVVRLKRSFRPDFVHVNFLGPSAVFHRQTFAAHPAPLLVTLRGMLPDQFFQAGSGLSSVFGLANWISANALAALEPVRRNLPAMAERSSVIYDGLDPLTDPPDPLQFEAPRLLCVGRLAPEKGFDLAVSAFVGLSQRFPTARLIIGGDGPERPSLERQVAELGLTSRVDFVGWVAPKRVQALMNSASLVVLPSWTEALPLVAAEAGQVARPVVATRVGGMPEVVVDGETGLLVEPGDSMALEAAIASLLEDPPRAERLAQAARRRAEELFSLDRCVGAYDALYRRLIEEQVSVRAG
jgi:glycosyltransferase involved in cell wall biosynthesis